GSNQRAFLCPALRSPVGLSIERSLPSVGPLPGPYGGGLAMREFSVRSLVWSALLALAVITTGTATASAQYEGETNVSRLGGSTRFSAPMRDTAALKSMAEANRTALAKVFEKAGLK